MMKPDNTYVFNIQHYSLHDGPGIRTVVFLKGCPLRCRWCCNPESQKYNREISYVDSKCIGLKDCGLCKNICEEGAISFKEKAVIDRVKCKDCLKCAAVCPSKAIRTEGEAYSVLQIIDLIERHAAFYSHGDGGLTVSGGEPLTQPDFLIPLLKEAKRRRINTAMETCGYGEYETLFEAAKYLDTVLFDIKSMNTEKHKEYTGYGNEKILENFQRLCNDYPTLNKIVRTPVIPGFNDSEEDMEAILRFIENKPSVSYEPLKYHSFGRGKYKALGRVYPMGDSKLEDSLFEELKNLRKPALL
ncbi:glycyl-radical enzyme activating protein [Aminipila butyrica]|uniref:Glycyl-radical enzyme activating protein n=1 Tax=Aminipila butyrica TaxID=433296 RepID=A0A858BR76_9FIRM|nr:glycyl-radical enzyme activating protein [Aminipila butyrica]QIB68027.1 glycyl-radical enzyme activating protein [Aminipila butyrica]